jgi:hypothetical protein
VELQGESTEHVWFKRTGGMSIHFRGHTVDIHECRLCGITAKSFGLGPVTRDSKYRAKKYATCGKTRVSP